MSQGTTSRGFNAGYSMAPRRIGDAGTVMASIVMMSA